MFVFFPPPRQLHNMQIKIPPPSPLFHLSTRGQVAYMSASVTILAGPARGGAAAPHRGPARRPSVVTAAAPPQPAGGVPAPEGGSELDQEAEEEAARVGVRKVVRFPRLLAGIFVGRGVGDVEFFWEGGGGTYATHELEHGARPVLRVPPGPGPFCNAALVSCLERDKTI